MGRQPPLARRDNRGRKPILAMSYNSIAPSCIFKYFLRTPSRTMGCSPPRCRGQDFFEPLLLRRCHRREAQSHSQRWVGSSHHGFRYGPDAGRFQRNINPRIHRKGRRHFHVASVEADVLQHSPQPRAVSFGSNLRATRAVVSLLATPFCLGSSWQGRWRSGHAEPFPVAHLQLAEIRGTCVFS